jgi:HNH endonuclease
MPQQTWIDIQRRLVLDPGTGCRNWSGSTFDNGYGAVSYHGRVWRVHRLIYFHYNPNADRRFKICHTCDNPPCGEISHLFQGTNQDNSDDMVSKSRQASGVRHGMATLSLEQVERLEDIHRLLPNLSIRAIGRIFGISHVQVSRILAGRSWYNR